MRIVALRNVSYVVDHVAGTRYTVAFILTAARPYPELKNSSDMLPVALPMIPNSRSLVDLVYH